MSLHADRMDRRWELVVIGVLAYICLGTVYSWSVFREPLVETYGFSTAETGIPYAVFLALFAFTMPLGGWLQGRIGTRATFLVGTALVGAAWVAAGAVRSIPALTVTYGIIGGSGVGLAYGVPLAVVASWFPARRGLAMGLTLIGFGLSPFITAPVAEAVIASQSVATAFTVFGIAFLVVLSGASFVMRPAHDPTHLDSGLERPAEPGPAQVLRDKRFWGLWITFALGTFAGLTAIGMSAAYGVEVVGVTGPTAAAAVAAFGVFNGAGRPLFGWITDKIGVRRAAIVAYLLIVGGALISVPAQGGAVAFYAIGFALLWLTLGGWLAIAPTATAGNFGRTHYAANYGLVYTAYGVGALSGGATSGVLTAVTGTLVTSLFAVAGAAGVGLALALWLLPRRG